MVRDMNVGIRVDAGRSMGLGHLMRCLTLAHQLSGEGVECVFLVRADDATALVIDAGHELLELPSEPADEEMDAAQCLAALDRRVDWLIVDHYGLGEAWERAMRGSAARMAAIDDLGRPHDVGLLLDQNELPDAAARYAGKVPKHARMLLGARFALLRPEFAREPRHRDGSIRRLLVSFGGSDPGNATSVALDALEQVGWTDRSVDVVVGGLHAHTDELAARCAEHPAWTLHVPTPAVGDLMRSADLALGAGGTSTWERCASALPALVVTIADNQRALAEATAAAGACRWLGDADDVDVDQIARELTSLDQAPEVVQHMSLDARGLCDGRGTRRVARALLAAELSFRPAGTADSDLALEWRNHPTVRQYSGSSDPISPEGHQAWFAGVLADKDRALLMCEHRGQPLAVVRFDGWASGEPEISIYVDPSRHGQGWGPEVLVAATEWLRSRHAPRQIRARIHADNTASHRAFAEAGFRQVAVEDDEQWWTLTA